jgi:hypothetical protein
VKLLLQSLNSGLYLKHLLCKHIVAAVTAAAAGVAAAATTIATKRALPCAASTSSATAAAAATAAMYPQGLELCSQPTQLLLLLLQLLLELLPLLAQLGLCKAAVCQLHCQFQPCLVPTVGRELECGAYNLPVNQDLQHSQTSTHKMS